MSSEDDTWTRTYKGSKINCLMQITLDGTLNSIIMHGPSPPLSRSVHVLVISMETTLPSVKI
jgi:hypothetical protein